MIEIVRCSEMLAFSNHGVTHHDNFSAWQHDWTFWFCGRLNILGVTNRTETDLLMRDSVKIGMKCTTKHLTIKHWIEPFQKLQLQPLFAGPSCLRMTELPHWRRLRPCARQRGGPAVGECGTQMISICVDVGEHWHLPPSLLFLPRLPPSAALCN